MYVNNTMEERDRLRAELDRERKEHAEEKVATAQMYGNSLRKLQLECAQYVHEKESLQRKLEETTRNHQIEMSAWKAEIERTRKEEAELERKAQQEVTLLKAQLEMDRKAAQEDREKLIQFYTAALDQKQEELTQFQSRPKTIDQFNSSEMQAELEASKLEFANALASAKERNRLELEQLNQTLHQLGEEKRALAMELDREKANSKDFDQVRSRVAELAAELEAKKAEVERFNQNIRQLQEEKQTFTGRLLQEQQKARDIDQLQRQLAERTAELEAKKAEAEQFNQSIRLLQEEKQTFMGRLLQEQQKGSNIDQLQRQLTERTTELEAAKAQMAAQLEAKDSRFEARQKEVQAELETAKLEFANALASANERNRLELEQLNQRLRQLGEEKRALVEELNREKLKGKDLDQMRRRVAELTAELQAKSAEHISILTSARERHNLEAEQTAAKLNHIIQQQQQELQELKAELARERLKAPLNQHKVIELEAQLQAVKLEDTKLLAMKEHERLEANHDVAELQADLEATRQEVAGVLATQRARKQLEAEAAQEKLKEVETKLNQAETKLKESEAKLVRISEELETTKAEVLTERERRRKDAEQAQTKLNQTIRRHYQQQQELTVEQEDQLSLALECAQLEKEKHGLQMKMEAAARENQAKLVEVKFELEGARKEVAEWRAEAERARKEAKEERERVVKERSVHEAELELHKDKFKELEELQHKVAALSAELAARKVEYENTLGSEREKFRFEMQKRNSTINQQLDEIEALTDQLSKDHQAEVTELDRKLNAEIEELKNELERTRQEAQTNQAKIIEDYTTTIRQLQEQLAERQLQPATANQPVVHAQTVQPPTVIQQTHIQRELPIDRRGSLTDNNLENEARRNLGDAAIIDNQPMHRRASLDSNIDTEAEVPLLNDILEKHSSSFPRRWQPRTCSLTTQKLFWISDKKLTKSAMGSVDLADMNSVSSQEGDDNMFVIQARTRDGSERTFEFKAPDTATRDRWVSAITSAIAPAKQRRNSLAMATPATMMVEPEIRVTEVFKKDEPSEGKLHKLLALI